MSTNIGGPIHDLYLIERCRCGVTRDDWKEPRTCRKCEPLEWEHFVCCAVCGQERSSGAEFYGLPCQAWLIIFQKLYQTVIKYWERIAS